MKRTMMAANKWCLILLSIFMIKLCDETEGMQLFHRGRGKGGLLKEPYVHHDVPLPPDEWFEQQLDHFNPTDLRTWKQRYFTNASFHVPGGPVFLMIGGEAAASAKWMVEGQWINYAQKYNALCFQLEHRYYGESHPTRNMGTKNLAYLSSEQALADLAYFIEGMSVKYELPLGTKWIAFGGSYPGSLAAWLRLKYPHLVYGSVSASGPLLAKADFREYYRVVKDDLSMVTNTCVSAVKEANSELRILMKHPIGQQTVNKLFKLCDPIDTSVQNDVTNFYESLAGNLAGVAQYNRDNRKSGSNITLDIVCDVMTNESIGTPVHRYAAVNEMLLNNGGENCLDYKYNKMINVLEQIDWQCEAAEGGRQWTYQTCTEFGFFQTSSVSSDLFGNEFPVDFFIQQCSDIFGKRSMISNRDWCFALFIICIIYFCGKSEGRRIYYRGRRYNGFVGTPKIPANTTVPKDEWFEQRLDHFNPTDAKMWQQRYFTNASFHVPGGPVFLLIGGEAEASPDWMVQGQWIIYAQKYKALCFQLEHRFYGQSHPTRSLTAKSLQYLTSQQSLADLAYFIKKITIKYELPPGTKWIVFGGSYPGSLAAWMRAKYPHLVHGAVSGSAPLLAKADFKEYLRIVKDDLSISNKSCVATIQEANRHLHTLMKTPMGQDTVNEIFQLCDPIDILEENDVANLYGSLASLLSGVAQYSGDNREGIDKKLNINSICEVLANESIGTPVHRYAAMIDMILSSEGEECLDYKYDNMITEMSQVDWESEEVTTGGRQWFYQTCTEFGFYQTSSLTADLFGDEFPLEFFVQQCSDVFGPRYNKEQIMRGIEMTNTMYGALHIEASRVVYVHGSLDPWHALGITKTVRQDSPAIYIRGTSHCADMYEPSANDPQSLMNARKMIDDLIGLWLDED